MRHFVQIRFFLKEAGAIRLFFINLKTLTMQLELFEPEKMYIVCHRTKAGDYKETKHPLNLPSAQRYLKFLLDACPWIEQAWINEIKKAGQTAQPNFCKP